MNNRNKYNQRKKSNIALHSLVGALIILLTFVIYISFFTGIFKDTAKTADDQLCRAFVAGKSTNIAKISDFLFQLKGRCKIDKDIVLDVSEKEETFEAIADTSARCWYRYGEGEFDFLHNYKTQGSWCFICGSLEMEDNQNALSYKDYVKWSKTHNVSKNNTYFNYINMLYINDENGLSSTLRQEFETMLSDDEFGEASDKAILNLLGEKITSLEELQLKSINSEDEKLYVVYRYDRIPKEFNQQMNDAIVDMGIGIVAGIGVNMLAEAATEMVVFGAISTGGCAFSGIATLATPACTVLGGAFGFVKGLAGGIWKSAKSIKKTKRVYSLMKKIGKVVSLSKKSKYLHEVELVEDVISNGATVKDIGELVVKIKNPKLKTLFEDSVRVMEKHGIDKLDDLPVRIKENPKILDELKLKPGHLRDSLDMVNIKKLPLEIKELDKLDADLTKVLGKYTSGKTLSKEDGIVIRDVLRVSSVLGGASAGIYVGISSNSNYNQYVDLLTREQYYRLCGTDPALSVS